MAFADWSDEDYQNFHDDAFDEIFNNLDFAYMSEVDIMAAEEMFEQGWLNMHLSAQQKEMWRNAFYNQMNMEFNREQWATYRELYDEANG